MPKDNTPKGGSPTLDNEGMDYCQFCGQYQFGVACKTKEQAASLCGVGDDADDTDLRD